MKSFWDERYETDHYVYGKEPNAFFAKELSEIPPGKILLPGEGEGRNAVFAALKGWTVDAFDQSNVGAEKAHRLAENAGVKIKYQVCEINDYPFEKHHYNVVALIFFHAPPATRRKLHSSVQEALKPGGLVILEAFHISQLGNNTGGPQSLEMLFDKDTILGDFSSLETILIQEYRINQDEGPFHQGEANVIRYIGVKK